MCDLKLIAAIRIGKDSPFVLYKQLKVFIKAEMRGVIKEQMRAPKAEFKSINVTIKNVDVTLCYGFTRTLLGTNLV